MNALSKFLLGFFTFLPIVLVILFFGFFFSTFLEIILELEQNQYHNDFPLEFVHYFFWFIAFIILISFVSLGIRIYYIVDTNSRTENDTNKRIMWTLLLIFVGTIASVVYYFIEILPARPASKAL